MKRSILYTLGIGTLWYLLKNHSSPRSIRRRVFISHSWKYSSKDYDRLKAKLENNGIAVYDHSIPSRLRKESVDDHQLRKRFRNQLWHCSQVFVLSHKNLPKQSYVYEELKIARNLRKRITVIKRIPNEPVPKALKKIADQIIPNNITAIKRCLQLQKAS